jgi:hypothetical protein
MQRPVAFTPRQIPDSHPDLADIKKKKSFALTFSILVFFLIAPFGYLLLKLGNPGGIIATAPPEGYFSPTLPLILGGTAGISIYLYISSVLYKKIRTR